jgi:hypothetical protein
MTHQNSITFYFSFMPYIWLGCVALFSVVGYVSIRHTKRGYTHSFTAVLLVIIGGSICGGAVLYLNNVGHVVDKMAYALFPQQYMPVDMWQRSVWHSPEDSRLLGMVTGSSDTELMLKDVHGHEWVIDPVVLKQYDWSMITPDTEVRVVGVVFEATRTVVGCMVLPGVPTQATTISALRAQRDMFAMRIAEYQSENMNHDPVTERKIAYIACQEVIERMMGDN